MSNFSMFALFFLSVTFSSLPLHLNPMSLGLAIFFIVMFLLLFFSSINLTLAAIITVLVYISGILILFSYFFSLIQNVKMFFFPFIMSLLFSMSFFTFFLSKNALQVSTMFSNQNSNLSSSFFWVINDPKFIILLILVLLLSMLFIEKVIGLKQKPLRLK